MSQKDDGLTPVSLWIAERSYRIRIKKEDEEVIRHAIKLADNKVDEFRQSYAGKDDQDFVAMALLMYAANQVTDIDEMNPFVADKVSTLEERIKETLELE